MVDVKCRRFALAGFKTVCGESSECSAPDRCMVFVSPKEYVRWLYGDDIEWLWWRTEYQSRGSAHAHGCVRLKNQPDVDLMYQNAVQGRRKGATVDDQKVGHRAEQDICIMADKCSVAFAIDLAKDALSDQRDPVFFEAPEPHRPARPHPASYVCFNDVDAENVRVAELLNASQRHSHRKSYRGFDDVTKEGKCRFGAPWPIEQTTRFAWTTGQNGPVGTLVYKRNDRWMNLYSPAGMYAHAREYTCVCLIHFKFSSMECEYGCKTNIQNRMLGRIFCVRM